MNTALNRKTKFDVVVVIPFYNEEKYIVSTLDSLKKQEVSSNISWCIVFVDNGSTDKTTDIIRKFFLNTDIPYAILYEPKRGTVYSRTLGLAKAAKISKNAIMSTDADTVLPKKCIEQTYKDISRQGVQVVSGRRNTNARVDLWKRIVSKKVFNWYRKLWNLEYLIFGPYFFGSYFALKAQLLKTIPLYNPEKHKKFLGEDIVLSRRCYYVGAKFKKSSLKVLPHPRRDIAYQTKGLGNYVGNTIYSHRARYNTDTLIFKPISAVKTKLIQKKILDFETKRLVWMTADAYTFWANTGYKYMNAYESFKKGLVFTGMVPKSIEKECAGLSQTGLYSVMVNKIYRQARKKLEQYLNANN